MGMSTIFSELIQTNIDANALSVSSWLDIRENTLVSFQVRGNTGSHGSHIVTLQQSFDKTGDALSTSSTVTGLGIKDNIQISTGFVRLKVTTVEGAASTIDILIQAK